MLRTPIVLVTSVSLLVAQMPPGFAQNAVSTPAQPAAFTPVPDGTRGGPAQDVTPSPVIVEAIKAYPKGGEQLSKRIEDLIVSDPKLGPGLAKYMQTAPDLSREQRQAVLRGVAAAMNRLGIQAADMAPVYKAPPAPVAAPPPVFEWWPLLLLAAAGAAAACIALCGGEDHPFVPITPLSP
jgi:hypothetical protein